MPTTRPAVAYSISHADVRRVANLRAMLIDANSDDRHAAQQPGRLYGDLTTALENLLRRLVGDDAAAATHVYDYLLDTYGGTAETKEAIQHGLERYADDQDHDARIVWTGTPDEPATDPRFRSADGARFRAIVPHLTW